jgi:valyl-tRNA synthetase
MANVSFLDDEAEDPADGIRIPLDGGSIVLFGLDQSVLGDRLREDLKTARGEVKRAESKLGNAKFVDRAPVDLVDEERAKISMYGRRAEELEAILEQL